MGKWRLLAAVTGGVSIIMCSLPITALAVTHSVGSGRVDQGIGWGAAEEVPGTAALNQGGAARVESVSCPTPGNCTVGGYYLDSSNDFQAFVVDETAFIWGNALEVPNIATLNIGGNATVEAVSCGSAGNCSAAGYYTDNSSGTRQAFVADERNGTWGAAQEVPGTAALNLSGFAAVNSVSCASAGNCSAGGGYTDSSNDNQAFVVGETNGTWGTAEEVPGTAALDQGIPGASVGSLSCAGAGDCSAGGSYTDSSGNMQAFVVGETNGSWGTAQEVPGTAALNLGGSAEILSVSCASAGNCDAGGYYTDSSGKMQVFVADETNGTWGMAQEVPGTAALNLGGSALVLSVSCGSAGNCGVGGYYADSSGNTQAFVADETNGTWGTAQEIPGTAGLNTGGFAEVNSLSCAAPGDCGAGGTYLASGHGDQAFIADEINGSWGMAQEVPGTAGLNQGQYAQISAVSCPAVGYCSAGGFYTDGSGDQQAFVVDEGTDSVGVINPGGQGSIGGDPVSLQMQGASDGGFPLTWSATGLPPGLTIDASSGLISGTLSATGTYQARVTATDSTGVSGSVFFNWTVVPPPLLPPAGVETGVNRPNPCPAGVTPSSVTSVPVLPATVHPVLAAAPAPVRLLGAWPAAGVYKVTITCPSGRAVTSAVDVLAAPPMPSAVGVGSDTLEDVFDQFSADYNNTAGAFPYLYSWDATNPFGGGGAIPVKTGCLPIARPDGSLAGITQLATFTKTSTGGFYCTSFARSSRPRAPADPPYAAGGVTFVKLASDTVTWATQAVTDAPRSLTVAQLAAIYTCTDTNWAQVGGQNAPIQPFLPQPGSGTRAFFLAAIGVGAPGGCVSDDMGQLQENEGVNPVLHSPDAIVPYSTGKYIAEAFHSARCLNAACTPSPQGVACVPTGTDNPFGCNTHGTMVLNQINGVPPTAGIGIHTEINLRFPAAFHRTLYDVVPYDPNTPNHIPGSEVGAPGGVDLDLIFGHQGWACTSPTAKTDLRNYGFLPIPACGVVG